MSRFFDLDPADYELSEAELDVILSPALILYLDKVRRNLATLVECADGDPDRLRPHVKTSKVPRVWAEFVRHGIRHFKCATTREAAHLLETLDEEGVEGDVLVAYPHVQPALRALGQLAMRHPRQQLSVLCEDPGSVDEIPPALGIFVDINPGMNRTGLEREERPAMRRIAAAAGPRFRGVHHYEGHVHCGPPEERRAVCHGLYHELMAIVHELEGDGHETAEVVTSGSPSFVPALGYEPFRELAGRHRVSPGTVVYFDARCEEDMSEVDFVPAALVLSRVISHPTPTSITVDAGSKALAAEAGDPCALVLAHPNLVARRPSEEHLPLDVVSGDRPPRGTPLLLFPRHVSTLR